MKPQKSYEKPKIFQVGYLTTESVLTLAIFAVIIVHEFI